MARGALPGILSVYGPLVQLKCNGKTSLEQVLLQKSPNKIQVFHLSTFTVRAARVRGPVAVSPPSGPGRVIPDNVRFPIRYT